MRIDSQLGGVAATGCVGTTGTAVGAFRHWGCFGGGWCGCDGCSGGNSVFRSEAKKSSISCGLVP